MARPLPDPAHLPPLGTLARSAMLLRAFALEQSDPARFYALLAADSARQVAAYAPLAGRTLLDVGGGPGYFADAFRAAGARYVGPGRRRRRAVAARPRRPPATRCSAAAWTCRSATGSLDVCYSSNVLEHVPAPGAHGRRDGARHPARRPGVPVLQQLARARTAATRRRRGTTWAAGAPPTATRPAPRPPAQERLRRLAVTAPRSPRCCAGPGAAGRGGRGPRSSTCARATTPPGPAGSSPCPACARS